MNSYYEKFANGTVKCIDDEIPFELPQNWEWCRLSLVAKVIGGFAFPSQDIKSTQGRRVIRISDFDEKGFTNKSIVRYNGNRELDEYLIRTDDILIAMTGGTVGKTTIVKEMDEPMLLNQRVAIIRNHCLILKYLETAINSPFIKEIISNKKKSTNDNISMVDILNFLIPIPPTKEQLKIATFLDGILPLVDKYGQSQDALNKLNTEISDKLKKSILQQAIQGKLVEQNPDEESASVLLDRIKDEKSKLLKEGKLKKKDIIDSVIFKGDDNKYYEQIGNAVIEITDILPFDIPDSWMWVRLGSLVSMSIGKTPSRTQSEYWKDGFIPWVAISDMEDYGRISSTHESLSETAQSIMGQLRPAGSLLMSFKLTVGRTAILDVPAYHNEAIISIKTINDKSLNIRDFLFLTLPLIAQSGESKDAIKGKTLNSKSLNNLLIPLPPYSEIRKIVRVIQQLFELLQNPVNLN